MAESISLDQFKQVELRTGRILEARPHPNADKLLVLKVDVGTETKQIVAGIRQHYQPEELVGRTVVVVNNLAPVVLRGEESRGMLLAASDGGSVRLLGPDAELPPGSEVR